MVDTDPARDPGAVGYGGRAKVYLVGAGPGDPRLITLRGRELLERADVILYDRLVSPSVLAYAARDAELIQVGKTPGGPTVTQEQINALMVAKAREGKTVVRLKGGDPFIFGRGGEEAEYLAAHGVDFEVVPGVTSAVAAPAYAGIPVTHREFASSVAFVTGHAAEGKPSGVDFARVASAVDTVVVLMGVAWLEQIVEQMLAGGLAPQTPVAFVEQGTTPRQRTIVTQLGRAADDARAAGLRPPAVMVVGRVATLVEKIAWFERLPLFGRTVVVTRPAGQAEELCRVLWELGAEVVWAPAISIEPPSDFAALDDALRRAGEFDWIVFTSANGVRATVARLLEIGLDVRALAGPRIAAIGPPTAAALRQCGLRADLVPDVFTTAALAEALLRAGAGAAAVLMLRAEGAPAGIVEKLRAGGAEVVEAAAYRVVRRLRNAGVVRELATSRRLNAVVLTSPSCVQGLVEGLGPDAAELLSETVAVCIGPVTAAAARGAGLKEVVVAPQATAEGVVEALVQVLAGQRGQPRSDRC